MAKPEIAVLVTSFERPGHLRNVLASIAVQQGVKNSLEVVVTDDGSRDETPRLVREFADSVSFPVHFTTHSHTGFHVARCRNEGVAATTAPYLLFLDGDCLIPPDHVRVHLERRQESWAMAGYCVHLDQETTERIDGDAVREGRFHTWDRLPTRIKLARMHLKASFYNLVGDPTRPKLFGGNIGISRSDYERVNGYDESYRGWGCEDDDLRLRLRGAGVRIASILRWTHTYHQWHPRTPSAPSTWREGANVSYFERPMRLTRCMAGLHSRRLSDLGIKISSGPHPRRMVEQLLPPWVIASVDQFQSSGKPAEIEFAVADGGWFAPESECRVLIVPSGMRASRGLAQQADLVFADRAIAGAAPERTFSIDSLDVTLRRMLGVQPPTPAQRRARLAVR